MDSIYLVLIGLALFGLLPLVVILIRKRKAEQILANGITTQATVSFIQLALKSTSIVHYQFRDSIGQSYKGKLTTATGQYQVGDEIEVFYLKENPKRNTVRGAWKSTGLIIFGVVIAMVVWFMVYKLYEMVRNGEI